MARRTTPEPSRPNETVASIKVRPVGWPRITLVALAYGAMLALVVLTTPPRHSGNVWSRYMTVESIIERGTLAVDRSPLLAISGSPDLIKVGTHLYSDKPPVLSLMGAAVYGVANRGWGLRMASSPASFTRVNAVLVIALVVLASSLAVAAVRALLQLAPIARWASDLIAIGFGLSSLLLSYGVTFNNHSVGAGLLAASMALLMLEEPGTRRRWRRIAAGAMTGLAATIDLPTGGAMLVSFGALIAWRDRAVPWSYLIGAIGPLAIHGVAQTLITGSPLPAELSPHLLGYEGSYWAGAGKWVEPGPRWRFALEFLVGPQGWLTVTPSLAVGLVGLAVLASRRRDPLQAPAVTLGAVVLVLLLYYVWGVRRTDFAGLSFGTRHLLAISPLVFAIGAIVLARFGRWWVWVGFAVLMIVGAAYAQAGMRDPWSRIERRDDAGLKLLKSWTPYPHSTYTR